MENKKITSCHHVKVRLIYFYFLGVGKEGSVFVIDRLQKYEFYLMYFYLFNPFVTEYILTFD